MGTPCAKNSVVSMLRTCRRRSAMTCTSSVGPSTPQFQLWLLEWPSRLFSRFASLCRSLYDTVSRSVKPSCAATKLMLAVGLRPLRRNRSEEPAKRSANPPSMRRPPCQNARMVSR